MRCGVQIEQNRSSRNRGVTLIELLMVMAVISLLVGFGVWGLRSAQDAQSRALAKSQVSMIAAAIEQFKSEVGFYPPGNGAGEAFLWLFNGVTGEGASTVRASNPASATKGPWLDPKGFSVEPNDGTFPITKVTDPWGVEFVYGKAVRGTEGVTGTPTLADPVAPVGEANNQGQFDSFVIFSWGSMGKASNVVSLSGAGNVANYIKQFAIHAE